MGAEVIHTVKPDKWAAPLPTSVAKIQWILHPLKVSLIISPVWQSDWWWFVWGVYHHGDKHCAVYIHYYYASSRLDCFWRWFPEITSLAFLEFHSVWYHPKLLLWELLHTQENVLYPLLDHLHDVCAHDQFALASHFALKSVFSCVWGGRGKEVITPHCGTSYGSLELHANYNGLHCMQLGSISCYGISFLVPVTTCRHPLLLFWSR